MQHVLNVTSEIGKLKTVLLHRPGEELNNLIPDYLERLLFDDIPHLEIAQQEHDEFAKILKNNGVEVLYLEALVSESLKDTKVKEQFMSDFIDESGIGSEHLKDALMKYFSGFSTKDMVDKMIAGVKVQELSHYKRVSLYEQVNADYPLVCDPLPNLYFTRDTFATIFHGITLNRMHTVTRNRESIFSKYVFDHHPTFSGGKVPIWYNRDEKTSLEGGDELVLSDSVLAIGISERTRPESIEKLSKRLFQEKTSLKTILAFDIPKKRAFMHLDTVFTMVDVDKFTIHPGIQGPLSVYEITEDESHRDGISVKKQHMKLEETLEKHLGKKITLIPCGGGDMIHAAREQWNDGSNTLAIAPGEVVVYHRNFITNRVLEENGVKLHIMPSSELSRGRGGPRCMSMPLVRENLKK